jgi:hypothetical protein
LESRSVKNCSRTFSATNTKLTVSSWPVYDRQDGDKNYLLRREKWLSGSEKNSKKQNCDVAKLNYNIILPLCKIYQTTNTAYSSKAKERRAICHGWKKDKENSQVGYPSMYLFIKPH